MKKLSLVAAVAAILLAPQWAAAESNVVTTGNASAKLDFRVVIPRVLFLQVGTGSLGNTTTVDQILFSPTAAEVVAGGTKAGTGGDLTNGAVTVRVLANSGDVSLGATAAALGMRKGVTTDYIPWTKVTATAAAGTTAGGFTGTSIAHPAINGTAQTITATSGVVQQVGRWTFAYANDVAYASGQYDGQVTYTASAP